MVVARATSPAPADSRRTPPAVVAAGAPARATLRPLRACAENLPDYMVPVGLRLPGALPLTPNGKVDRRRLPAPEIGARSGERHSWPRAAGPRTRSRRSGATCSRLDQVGVDDNFFDLGGHSLLLVQVQAQLRRALDHEIAIVELFQYPTDSSAGASIWPGPPRPTARDARDRASAEGAGRRRSRSAQVARP